MSKILVAVLGIGESNFVEKKKFLRNNIDLIKKTSKGLDVNFVVFNYSNNSFINFSEIKVIKEKGIVGEYIYKHLCPKLIQEYDYVVIMLADIELSPNFNINEFIRIYKENNLNIISPCLTRDSKYSYSFMLENNAYKSKLRITNYIELFFYLMDMESYKKYYSIFDNKTYWTWGIDQCLHLMGFRLGITNDIKIKHYYKGVDYKEGLPDPYAEMYDKNEKYGAISKMMDLELIDLKNNI